MEALNERKAIVHRHIPAIPITLCLMIGALVPACTHGNQAADTRASEDLSLPCVDVFSPPEGGYPNIRIPAIVFTEKGTLLAFAEGRQGGDHSENDIILKRSGDGGATWGPVQIISEMGGDSLNDPCAVVLDSGRVLLLFQRFPQGYHARRMEGHTEMAELGYGGPRNTQTFLTHSDDDGITWTPPRDITQSIRRPDAISVGSPGIGIQLAKGSHKGRVLCPLYETIPMDGGRYWRNAVAISDDGGKTWRYSERVPHEGLEGYSNEAQIVELADGTILLSSRNQGGRPCRKSARSRDAGETWEPMREDPDLVTPPCMGSVVSLPRGVGEKPLLLISLPNTTKPRRNGTVFISADEGETWPLKRTIYPGGFAYSCLVALPENKAGCLFERDGYRYTSFTTFGLDYFGALPSSP